MTTVPGSAAAAADARPTTAARAWFGVTALTVLVALVIQLPVAAVDDGSFFTSPATRMLNVFAFFTILSNVIVGVTCALLALGRGWEPARAAGAFAVWRFTGVVAIAITGVVYHTLLRGLVDLTPWGTVADLLEHTVVPILAIAGWLLFGPRGRATTRVAVLALAYPVAWLAFTLVRGEIVDWYPYPFLDVLDLGYGRVIVNVLGVTALFLAAAFGLAALDRWLTTRAPR